MKKQRPNQGVAIVQALCSARDFFFVVIVVEILVDYLPLKKESRKDSFWKIKGLNVHHLSYLGALGVVGLVVTEDVEDAVSTSLRSHRLRASAAVFDLLSII